MSILRLELSILRLEPSSGLWFYETVFSASCLDYKGEKQISSSNLFACQYFNIGIYIKMNNTTSCLQTIQISYYQISTK